MPKRRYRVEDPSGADIARTIREVRKDAGLRQVDLAERLRVTQQNVVALESADLSPTLKTLLRVAAALDTTLVVEFRPRSSS